MIGLIQRVEEAHVEVSGAIVGRIGCGLLALVGIERADTEREGARLLERMLGYRVFPDEADRMNRSLRDVRGALLLVPQFTLAADTAGGTRPSFTPAAPPEHGSRLFDQLLERARASHPVVAAGRFGAAMKVHLVNDGPVTFWLRVAPKGG